MIAPLGFQLTTGYNLGYQSTQFIPWNFVKDIIINEGFSFVSINLIIVLLNPIKQV